MLSARSLILALALVAAVSATTSSRVHRSRVGATWVSATPSALKPTPQVPQAPPPPPPPGAPQQAPSTLFKECDPSQTPALRGTDRAAKVAAFKACLGKLTQPMKTGLARYVAEKRWDGATFVTIGDEGKFKSWEGKDPVQVQTAFIQGKETAIMVNFIKGKFGPALTTAGLAAADAVLREVKGKSLKELYTAFTAKNPTFVVQKGFSTTFPNYQAKFMPYYIAAVQQIYPQIYECLVATVNQNFPKTKEGFKMPQKPKDLTDEYWRLFSIGYGAGFASASKTDINTTGGRGVYFAMQINDVKDHGDKCKRCNLKEDAKLVVLDEIEKTNIAVKNNYANAVSAGILWSPPTKVEGVVTMDLPEFQLMNPTGKNIFNNPSEAEEALQGYGLIFRPSKLVIEGVEGNPYLADKGVIDYLTCVDCTADLTKLKAPA